MFSARNNILDQVHRTASKEIPGNLSNLTTPNSFPTSRVHKYLNQDAIFINFVFTALKNIQYLFDFIENVSTGQGNVVSALINGGLISITKFTNQEKYRFTKKYISDFFVNIISYFEISSFKEIIKNQSMKASNPLASFVWNPIDTFIKYINEQSEKQLEQYNKDLKTQQAVIDKLKRTQKYIDDLMVASNNDREKFMDTYNKDKINNEVFEIWKKYSSNLYKFVRSIPTINSEELNIEFKKSYFEDYSNIIRNEISYADSISYTIVFVKKKVPGNDFIEIIDKTKDETQASRKLKWESPRCAFLFDSDQDPKDYEFKDCSAETLHAYVYRKSEAAESIDLDDMKNLFQTFVAKLNRLKKLKNNYINIRDLAIKFGPNDFDDFKSFLTEILRMSMDQIVAQNQTFSRPVLEFKDDYELVETNKLYDRVVKAISHGLVASNKINEIQEKLDEIKSSRIDARYQDITFPNNNEKFTIDMQKVKKESLFIPIIQSSNNQIKCSFTSLDISLQNISQLHVTPFEIHLPIVGNAAKEFFRFETDDESIIQMQYSSDEIKIIVKLASILRRDQTITGTLYIKEMSIPVRIDIRYRDFKCYIKSCGNKFVYDKPRKCFQIKKDFIFTDESIDISVIDDEGCPVQHYLTFEAGTNSRQTDPPIHKYNEKTCVSNFFFDKAMDSDMIININLSQTIKNKLYFTAKVLERTKIALISNINSLQMDDSDFIYAGDLNCQYEIQFMLYSINEKTYQIDIIPSSQNMNVIFDKKELNGIITSNKFSKFIGFSVSFNNKTNKIENIKFRMKAGEIIIEKNLNVIPCYISLRKSYGKILFDWEIPSNHKKPTCCALVYNFVEQKYEICMPNEPLPEKNHDQCIITPFSYKEYNVKIPNKYSTIEYDPSTHDALYPSNVENYIYLVIEPDGRYFICHRTELKLDHKIICGRLSCSTRNLYYDEDITEKWRNVWFPITNDVEKIIDIFKEHSGKLYSIFQKFMKFACISKKIYNEFLNLKDSVPQKAQVYDFIRDIFKNRIYQLIRQKNHLCSTLDVKDVFDERNNIQPR